MMQLQPIETAPIREIVFSPEGHTARHSPLMLVGKELSDGSFATWVARLSVDEWFGRDTEGRLRRTADPTHWAYVLPTTEPMAA